MPLCFRYLPTEVKNKIYRELLVHTNTIFLDITAWSRQPSIFGTSSRCYSISLCLYPSILLLNKTVHHEASSLLCSQNRFEIEDSELLTAFLNQRPRNAAFLRHLIAVFPKLQDSGNSGMATTDDESLRMLDLIHEKCDNIIILSLRTEERREFLLNAFGVRIVDQALMSLDAQLRAILTLRKLRIQVCNKPNRSTLREKMGRYGWIAETVKDSDGRYGYDPYEDDDVYDACDACYHYDFGHVEVQ